MKPALAAKNPAAAPTRLRIKPLYASGIGALVALLGLLGPFTVQESAVDTLGPLGLAIVVTSLLLAVIGRDWAAVALLPLGLLGAFQTVSALWLLRIPGDWGYWALLWGFLVASLGGVWRVSLVELPPETGKAERTLRGLLPPAAIPFALLLTWQGLVSGYTVPKGIFPGVLDVWTQLTVSFRVLLADSYVTFVKEVLFGFTLGLIGGFTAAIAIAFSPFLQRGFLPLAAAFGAVPIVGLAPVLGRAFGVNWESKAAVVVIVTFFPVVLNTVQGLVNVDPLKLELLRAYAAKPREVFFKLRLPNSLPYLFNALKLAAVISVVSVIVAEFLIPGPPEGLGQRISLSARRGAFDVVFAAIAVTSIISFAFYSLLSLVERWLTGWHPSFREEPR
ncbi:MAG: ABC transporter permease [Trueperaceae bacterium]